METCAQCGTTIMDNGSWVTLNEVTPEHDHEWTFCDTICAFEFLEDNNES